MRIHIMILLDMVFLEPVQNREVIMKLFRSLVIIVSIGILFIFLTSVYGVVRLCDRADRLDLVKQQQITIASKNFIINYRLNQIRALERELNRTQVVTISFYHPASGGINSDSDPDNTAFMRKPVPGKTVAISPELTNMGWGDANVYIPGYGVFIMEDKMDKSVKGLQIDICVASKKIANKLGIKRNITVTRLIHG